MVKMVNVMLYIYIYICRYKVIWVPGILETIDKLKRKKFKSL